MFGGIWYLGGSFPFLSSYLRKIYLTVGYLSTIGDLAPGIWLAGRWWTVKGCLTSVFVGEALAHWHLSVANSWGSRLGLCTQHLCRESLPTWCYTHANCPYDLSFPQFQAATLLQPFPTTFSLFWALPNTDFHAWFYTITYHLFISSRYFLSTSCYMQFLLTHIFHIEMSWGAPG